MTLKSRKVTGSLQEAASVISIGCRRRTARELWRAAHQFGRHRSTSVAKEEPSGDRGRTVVLTRDMVWRSLAFIGIFPTRDCRQGVFANASMVRVEW